MKSGNAAILKHKQEGRALRVFKGACGPVEYLGEFDIDEERIRPTIPWLTLFGNKRPGTKKGKKRRS